MIFFFRNIQVFELSMLSFSTFTLGVQLMIHNVDNSKWVLFARQTNISQGNVRRNTFYTINTKAFVLMYAITISM